MAHRVDTVSHSVEAADGESMIDGIFSQPQVEQLSPRNHPMLPLRQPCNVRIEAGGPARLPAKPREPAYFAG